MSTWTPMSHEPVRIKGYSSAHEARVISCVSTCDRTWVRTDDGRAFLRVAPYGQWVEIIACAWVGGKPSSGLVEIGSHTLEPVASAKNIGGDSPAELGRKEAISKRCDLLDLLEKITEQKLPRGLADHAHATATVRQWKLARDRIAGGDAQPEIAKDDLANARAWFAGGLTVDPPWDGRDGMEAFAAALLRERDQLAAEVERQRETLVLVTVRADAAARERDELLRAAANIGIQGLADEEGLLAPHETAGAMFRSGVSMCVAGVRLHPTAKTGLACDVNVDGRCMEVIAQWQDAPVRTNWVAMAADMLGESKRADAAEARLDRIDESNRHSVGEALGLHSDCDPALAWHELGQALSTIGAHLRADGWTWCRPSGQPMTPDDWRVGTAPTFAKPAPKVVLAGDP